MLTIRARNVSYQIIEEIYKGSRTVIYRGYRETDRTPVVLKMLNHAYPRFSELVQFRNQYTIAQNLNLPGVVQIYSLEPYQNGYILVMEDYGGVSLKTWMAGKPLDLEEFLQIAIELSNILNLLYRQLILHKDIKPANILINPETKQIKLIDFSIASLLSRETQTLTSPNLLEGTLGYLSPEQTGRMNRGIDYRTDFYSLGVTFYELLTGQLPFQSDDALELIHCHIAKQPPLVHEINPQIPPVLSSIVNKLMSKNAEDRYQSALGLKFDLENCLHQLQEKGVITSFEIGQRDIGDRFIIPEKLYGREAEVKTLLAAFERVAENNTELMLVAGFSGIGKTAIVNEVHKPIARQHGYFIKGKFDQFNRNVPFSAFVQAFRDLMGLLLSENDAQLADWKNKILQALGENGQVIIEVIPELEKIIGQQPLAIELSGTASQNRFNLLFQKFIQIFTKKEHPLVIFLDDLQWADSASLQLIKLLMKNSNGGYLLLIGAYRDNEVYAAHPLVLTLEEIRKEKAIINTIALAPLSQESLNHLVAETLNCSLEIALPLTQLIYQKTQGNPFFCTQFLKALHEDGLIQFDLDQGNWQCDIAQIKALTLTDDIVEFMALQLQRLPATTQNVLKLAACIGNQFDLETLAIVAEQSEVETATQLWKALQEGFILPQSEIYKFYLGQENPDLEANSEIITYKFLHDRVQQAAYSLIPDHQKQNIHYHIGQLLLEKIPPESRAERIFELVNQLNHRTAKIKEQTERDQLVQLNLIACRKAKASTAYQAARDYARVGLSLLGEQAWQQQYEITLTLHELAAEVAFLCSEFAQMEQLINTVIEQVHSLLEQVNVYRIRIQAHVSQNKRTEAIAIGQHILQQLGVTFLQTPTPTDIQQEIQQIKELIGDREIKDLIHLTIMTDEEKIAIVQIINSILGAASTSGSPLFPLLTMLSVKLSIQYGNTAASAISYVAYGIILCNFLQDVDTATQFAQLALQVTLKLDAKTNKPEVLFVTALFMIHRKSHIHEILPVLQESYAAALEVGNLEYVGYSASNFCTNSFWCGQSLSILEQDARAYSHKLVQLNQLATANWSRIYWQFILNLMGFGEQPGILSGEAFEETELLPLLLSANNVVESFLFYLYKIILCFLFEEIPQAKNHAFDCRRYLIGIAGTVSESVFYFYDSLVALAQFSPQPEEQSVILELVAQNQAQLQHWVYHAPMNYQHKFDLVEAEKYRVLGKNYEAGDWYDRAISGAKKNEYLQEEALGNELAAKFYLGWGKEKIAAVYMQEAYYFYARWGAKAKTNDLEKRYPQLLAPILQVQQNCLIHQENYDNSETIDLNIESPFLLHQTIQTSRISNSTKISDVLDFATILKASQALSSQIQLEQLLSTLVKVVMENAGADKCVLILPRDENLVIEAMAILGNENTDTQSIVLQSIPLETNQDIPISLINYVSHTQEILVINDASIHNSFASDVYIQKQQPKSLLCTPIINQGKLIGIIYLENNLTVEVFTSDRLQVINLLMSQAAISLENAKLYETLEEKVEIRTQELKEKATQLEETLQKLYSTQSQLIQAEKMSSLGQLVAGIAHEINNPVSFIYGNLTHANEYITSLIELIKLYQELYPQPRTEIQTKIEEIELEYLITDLQKLFVSMRTGSDRIRKIVESLRNFSRLDEAEIKPVDIHSGIDSTLSILQHRLHGNYQYPKIQVIKEYAQLPLIKCYASLLNQVFMNIFNNAIDALQEVQKNHIEWNKQPTIRITTAINDAQNLVVSIADNGLGIDESIKNRIFEPFFTTKPVGKGTGMGLSISYSIVVEKHQGKLSCNSTIEEGTEFIIEIPIS